QPYYYTGYYGAVPYGYGYAPLFGPFAGLPYGYGPLANYGYGYTYYPYYGYLPYYATYGVIAYSPSTDTGGTAWGESTIEGAASAAIQNCGHADCKTVVWVQGGCAAFSTNIDGGAMGWAFSGNLPHAKENAL